MFQIMRITLQFLHEAHSYARARVGLMPNKISVLLAKTMPRYSKSGKTHES